MRTHSQRIALGMVAIAVVLAFSIGTAQAQNKCLSGKTKCVSKKMAAKLKCRAKCQKDPAKCGAVQAACFTKATAKFDGGTKGIAKGCLGKLELKNDGPCVTFGDTASLESKVDAYVLDVVSELEPVPPLGINKCLSDKTKCVIKKTAGLLKCREKCQKDLAKCGAVQTACETKVIAKFDGGTKGIANGCIGKLDIKNDGPCLTFGDTTSLETKVDAFVLDVKAELEITITPIPTPTHTPTPAGTPIACTGGSGGPECDGTCPPGKGCVYDDVLVECYCIDTLNPCNWLIHPMCGAGDCPPGLSCVDYWGWGCACQTPPTDCCGPQDLCIDADGTASTGTGGPQAAEVGFGDSLSDFPVSNEFVGLDWFDNDHDGQWTAGDDLHSEGPSCLTGIKDGDHDLGFDCKILDLDGSLFDGQQVDCDLEINNPFTEPHLSNGGCDSSLNGIRFHDANANGLYDDGEDLVLDRNGDGVCN